MAPRAPQDVSSVVDPSVSFHSEQAKEFVQSFLTGRTYRLLSTARFLQSVLCELSDMGDSRVVGFFIDLREMPYGIYRYEETPWCYNIRDVIDDVLAVPNASGVIYDPWSGDYWKIRLDDDDSAEEALDWFFGDYDLTGGYDELDNAILSELMDLYIERHDEFGMAMEVWRRVHNDFVYFNGRIVPRELLTHQGLGLPVTYRTILRRIEKLSRCM